MWDEFFFYLFDIITTVSLYEAVTILSLEKKEKLADFKNLLVSVSVIHRKEQLKAPRHGKTPRCFYEGFFFPTFSR